MPDLTLDQQLAAALPTIIGNRQRTVEAVLAVLRDAPPDTLATALGMERMGHMAGGKPTLCPADCGGDTLYRFVRPSDTRTEPGQ